jgi:hypothetical protein
MDSTLTRVGAKRKGVVDMIYKTALLNSVREETVVGRRAFVLRIVAATGYPRSTKGNQRSTKTGRGGIRSISVGPRMQRRFDGADQVRQKAAGVSSPRAVTDFEDSWGWG